MKRHACVVSLAVIAFLSGCNLDDDSSSGTAPPELSGRVIKGVIQHGMVSAYSWKAGEWVWLETSFTDREGDFRFGAPFPSGPVKLVVEAAADGSSSMMCDAAHGCGWAGLDAGDVNRNGSFDYGEVMPLDSSFALTTILPSGRAAGPVAVTPTTHLAAGLAERLPGGVSSENLALSHARVADLFGLEDDFALRRPVDPVDGGEVAVAADADVRHALVNAAFAELAGGGPVADVLDLGVDSLVMHGGQLPRAALEKTADAAVSVLAVLSLDASRRAALVDQLTSLKKRWEGSFSESTAGSSSSVATQFKAGLFLGMLDQYGSQLGIDASGSFSARHGQRLSWLSSRQVPALSQLIPSLGLIMVQAALTASQPDLKSLNLVQVSSPTGLEATYDRSAGTTSIRGVYLGHEVEVLAEVSAFTDAFRAGKQSFRLLPGSTLVNDLARTQLEITLDIDYLDTPVEAFAEALDARDQLAMNSAMAEIQERLRISVQWHGRLILEDSLDSSRSLEGTAAGRIDVDFPAGRAGDPVLVASVDELHLTSPFGDEISNSAGLPAVILTIGGTDDTVVHLDVTLFGMPGMRVTVSGSSGLSGAVARTVGSTNAIGPLALQAEVVLSESGDSWRVEVREGGEVEIMSNSRLLPNVRLAFPAEGAGYLYVGNELAGTVTLDPANVGLIIHGSDGVVRRRYAQPEALRQESWTPWSELGWH